MSAIGQIFCHDIVNVGAPPIRKGNTMTDAELAVQETCNETLGAEVERLLQRNRIMHALDELGSLLNTDRNPDAVTCEKIRALGQKFMISQSFETFDGSEGDIKLVA